MSMTPPPSPPLDQARVREVAGSAVLSACGTFRYRLERDLGGDGPIVAIFMVNPSTADAEEDDHTIRKLKGFGARHGWSRIIVGNVCAYRATDVKELETADDPDGPDNAEHICAIMSAASFHVAAWGPLGKLPRRLRTRWRIIDQMAAAAGVQLHCIGKAKDGHPRHPLMLAYETPIVPWIKPL